MLTEKDIPNDSLLKKYLPADYCDGFVYEVETAQGINPDDIQLAFWLYQPKWLELLFKLRHAIVKPFGLATEGTSAEALENCIRNGGQHSFATVEKQKQETVIKLKDSHLDAYISVYVEENGANKKIYTYTLVKIKNRLGKIYFFVIKPFHKVIVKSILKSSVTSVLSKQQA